MTLPYDPEPTKPMVAGVDYIIVSDEYPRPTYEANGPDRFNLWLTLISMVCLGFLIGLLLVR
jgi:hypothetical protein